MTLAVRALRLLFVHWASLVVIARRATSNKKASRHCYQTSRTFLYCLSPSITLQQYESGSTNWLDSVSCGLSAQCLRGWRHEQAPNPSECLQEIDSDDSINQSHLARLNERKPILRVSSYCLSFILFPFTVSHCHFLPSFPVLSVFVFSCRRSYERRMVTSTVRRYLGIHLTEDPSNKAFTMRVPLSVMLILIIRGVAFRFGKPITRAK